MLTTRRKHLTIVRSMALSIATIAEQVRDDPFDKDIGDSLMDIEGDLEVLKHSIGRLWQEVDSGKESKRI